MSAPAALERRFISSNPTATRELAASLAAAARPGDLICLCGELGAGKTQFAKGFGAGLGVTDTINSPSYILMAEYAGRLPLFHIDLYRLADASDALAGGLLDERQAGGRHARRVARADERAPAGGPARRVDRAETGDRTDTRAITIRAVDPSLDRYLEVIA